MIDERSTIAAGQRDAAAGDANEVEAHNAALAAFLRSPDAPPCPQCGYQLRGCASDRCPECGAALRLTLARPERATRAWLLAVFGLALAVLVLLPLVFAALEPVADLVANPYKEQLIQAGFAHNDLPNWTVVIGIVSITLAMVALLALAIASRRALGRMSRPLQVIVGLAGALAPLAALGAAALLIAWV